MYWMMAFQAVDNGNAYESILYVYMYASTSKNDAMADFIKKNIQGEEGR